MNRNIFSMGGISKLNSFLQTVGALGIIASLIFVGLELRQTQKIALASQNQSRTETLIQGSEFLYENGLATHEWLKNGVQEKDRDVIATYKHMAWWIYNNDYSQYKAGLMETSLFEAKRDGPMTRNVNGKNYLECIISKEVWNVRKNNFQPDFAELINSLSIPCRDLEQ
tara:strand:+ start:35224 stop:35730 length:507 start_codon:yes stop_codon:yes gene_type:complete